MPCLLSTCCWPWRGATIRIMTQLISGLPVTLHLLQNLVARPHHQYAESAPALTTAPCDAWVAKIIGYRQMADATLLPLARVHGIKLVTFDQAVAVASAPRIRHISAKSKSPPWGQT